MASGDGQSLLQIARSNRERLSEHCTRLCPALFDRERASPSLLGVRLMMVFLHALYVGVLFLFDQDLVWSLREKPWYTGTYLIFLLATLVQYFYTSGSSPGYVIDAMRAENQKTTLASKLSGFKQAVSRNGNPLATPDQLERQPSRNISSSWSKVVMDLYPPGSASRNWTCTYCNILQPPRSKHCYDCDKCVLQFDHHCVWLGTCIGQGNHRLFWWYIFEESILCTWTVVLYFLFLSSYNGKDWWKNFILIILLASLLFCLVFLLLLLLFHSYLALTNQTTYELVRRRRILYMRGIPERVHPFSNGIRRNLYAFCCSKDSMYKLEAVPTLEELEPRTRPYKCMDIISCRCC